MPACHRDKCVCRLGSSSYGLSLPLSHQVTKTSRTDELAKVIASE
jgi:hypothetical protein